MVYLRQFVLHIRVREGRGTDQIKRSNTRCLSATWITSFGSYNFHTLIETPSNKQHKELIYVRW